MRWSHFGLVTTVILSGCMLESDVEKIPYFDQEIPHLPGKYHSEAKNIHEILYLGSGNYQYRGPLIDKEQVKQDADAELEEAIATMKESGATEEDIQKAREFMAELQDKLLRPFLESGERDQVIFRALDVGFGWTAAQITDVIETHYTWGYSPAQNHILLGQVTEDGIRIFETRKCAKPGLDTPKTIKIDQERLTAAGTRADFSGFLLQCALNGNLKLGLALSR
jgi:hypothetical protein